MAESERPLVLLVEDFDDARELYAELLAFAGFRVARAASGEEAIARALELAPDVVLMDLALPAVNGWEATQRLKEDPRTAGVPVIALSGHALETHRQRALAVGCADFLTKPCLPEALVEAVRRVLRGGDVASGGAV